MAPSWRAGCGPGDGELVRAAVYDFHATVAATWRPRAAAAGGRRRPPDAAVHGPGHVLGHPRRRQPGLEAARRAARRRSRRRCWTATRPSGGPHVERCIELSIEAGRLLDDPVFPEPDSDDGERWSRLPPLAGTLPADRSLPSRSPSATRPASRRWRAGGRRRLLDDVAGPGWYLVSDGPADGGGLATGAGRHHGSAIPTAGSQRLLGGAGPRCWSAPTATSTAPRDHTGRERGGNCWTDARRQDRPASRLRGRLGSEPQAAASRSGNRFRPLMKLERTRVTSPHTSKCRSLRQQLHQEHAHLQAGQPRPQAEVRPSAAEGDVAVGVAPQVERVGVGELLLVVVRRQVPGHDLVPGGNPEPRRSPCRRSAVRRKWICGEA